MVANDAEQRPRFGCQWQHGLCYMQDLSAAKVFSEHVVCQISDILYQQEAKDNVDSTNTVPVIKC